MSICVVATLPTKGTPLGRDCFLKSLISAEIRSLFSEKLSALGYVTLLIRVVLKACFSRVSNSAHTAFFDQRPCSSNTGGLKRFTVAWNGRRNVEPSETVII